MKFLPCALVLLVLPASNFALPPPETNNIRFDAKKDGTLVLPYHSKLQDLNYLPDIIGNHVVLPNVVTACANEPKTTASRSIMTATIRNLTVIRGAIPAGGLPQGQIPQSWVDAAFFWDNGAPYSSIARRSDTNYVTPNTVTLKYHCTIPPKPNDSNHITINLVVNDPVWIQHVFP